MEILLDEPSKKSLTPAEKFCTSSDRISVIFKQRSKDFSALVKISVENFLVFIFRQQWTCVLFVRKLNTIGRVRHAVISASHSDSVGFGFEFFGKPLFYKSSESYFNFFNTSYCKKGFYLRQLEKNHFLKTLPFSTFSQMKQLV